MGRRPKQFGVPPVQVWAVFCDERILGGNAQLPLFWTKAGAKEFVKTLPFWGYAIVPVTIHQEAKAERG